MVAAPERLEDAVGEPEPEEAPELLPREEMVHAEHRVLREGLVQQPVQLLGRLEVLPEGLLDYDPTALREPGPGERRDRRFEVGRRQGKIGDDRLAQVTEGSSDALALGHVSPAVLENLPDQPDVGVGRDFSGMAPQALLCEMTELFVVPVPAMHPDDPEILWEFAPFVELG